MKYRKLDANGDYTLGTGADFWINTPDAVGQAVMTRLLLWAGEWFLDVTDGTPWSTKILGHRQNGNSPDVAIKQRILGTPNVTDIVNYSSTFDGNTRTLSVDATINTAYGQTAISVNL